MAINVYSGLMGSGKSYEVVGNVIVNAVGNGRRVVSNIEGLQPEKIRSYAAKKFGVELDEVGQIIPVTDDDVKRAAFFPTDDPERTTVVKGGDLVAIDEAWKFWGSGATLLPEHMEFFRKHRHYVDEKTKVSCDIAIMIQDVTDLQKSLKNVVEMTFKTVKLKSLGLSKKYRVEFYEGTRLMKKAQIGYRVNDYKKEIFPLYQSYAGGQGAEKVVDNRQNVFKNSSLWIFVVVMFFVSIFSFYKVYQFFKPESQNVKVPVTAEKQKESFSSGVSQPAQQSSNYPPIQPLNTWRIVGHFNITGDTMVVLEDTTTKQIKVEHPSNFHGYGLKQFGTVDGLKVFRYTYSTTKGATNDKNDTQK